MHPLNYIHLSGQSRTGPIISSVILGPDGRVRVLEAPAPFPVSPEEWDDRDLEYVLLLVLSLLTGDRNPDRAAPALAARLDALAYQLYVAAGNLKTRERAWKMELVRQVLAAIPLTADFTVKALTLLYSAVAARPVQYTEILSTRALSTLPPPASGGTSGASSVGSPLAQHSITTGVGLAVGAFLGVGVLRLIAGLLRR